MKSDQNNKEDSQLSVLHDKLRDHKWIGVLIVFTVTLSLVPLVRVASAYFAVNDWEFYDDGVIAYAGYRTALGEVPHRDFQYYYSGGFEVLLGGLFRVLGASFLVAQWTLGALMAVTASLVYLIQMQLGVRFMTGMLLSVCWTFISFMIGFHIFPAWPAQACILGAIILLAWGWELEKKTGYLWAGVLLGVASCMKQTIGVYGLFGFILAEVFLGRVRERRHGDFASTAARSSRKNPVSLWMVTLFVLVTPVFFIFLLRRHFDAANVLFLLLPIAVLGVLAMKRLFIGSAGAPGTLEQDLSKQCLNILVLSGGFALGFLVILAYYAGLQGMEQFLYQTFFGVEHQVTRQFSGFTSSVLAPQQDVLRALRRIGVFCIPVVAGASALLAGNRAKQDSVSKSAWALLTAVGVTLVVLNFTLYPNPIQYLIAVLLPLVIIPFVYITERFVRQRFTNDIVTAIVVGLITFSPAIMYCGFRLASGDISRMIVQKISYVDTVRGRMYIPTRVAETVMPVINYLVGRPSSETFLAYDLYNKAFGFLSDRPVSFDYGQKFNFYEVGDAEIDELIRSAEKQRIDIIVVGKVYLQGSASEKKMFEYLDGHYVRVLTTSAYFVYQIRQGSTGQSRGRS